MSLSLYWDLQNQRLVPSLYSTGKITAMTFVLRDKVPVSLALVTEQASTVQPYTVTELASGQSIRFGAKTAVTESGFVVSQFTWADNGEELPDRRYTADIDLNTAELIAAIGVLSTIALVAEFTILNGDGSNELSTQFTLNVIPDVIVGTEGVPVSADDIAFATPAFVVAQADAIKTPTGGLYRLKNGALQLYNNTTGKYQTMTLAGAAGSEYPSFGPQED